MKSQSCAYAEARTSTSITLLKVTLGNSYPHSQALVRWQRKEPGTHCLCMLSFPKNLEISVKYAPLY